MRKGVTAVLMIGAMTMLGGVSNAKEWYEGGTLHRATLADWVEATPENRFATSGDFAASLKLTSDMKVLRSIAAAINSCVDEVAVDPALGNQPVTSIAAACISLLSNQ